MVGDDFAVLELSKPLHGSKVAIFSPSLVLEEFRNTVDSTQATLY